MKFNSKIWTVTGVIVSVVALILTIYYANREKTTSLEIKKVSDIELTRPLNVAKLSSTYLYDSIPVEHLWQTSFVIKNIGENALYGDGFDNKNIKDNALKLHIKNCDKLLSINIVDNTTDGFLVKDSLKFSQWRPNEYVELLLLSDGPVAPEITINDRDIQNATISHVIYSPKEQLVEPKMMDKLPRALNSALWWITIVLDTLWLLITMYLIKEEIVQMINKKSNVADLIPFILLVVCIILSLLWML